MLGAGKVQQNSQELTAKILPLSSSESDTISVWIMS